LALPVSFAFACFHILLQKFILHFIVAFAFACFLLPVACAFAFAYGFASVHIL
jgi:hypothetical protein